MHKAWIKRESEGEFITVHKELVHDETFFEYFRVSQTCFNMLLHKIEGQLD